jgi:hypothetical protein
MILHKTKNPAFLSFSHTSNIEIFKPQRVSKFAIKGLRGGYVCGKSSRKKTHKGEEQFAQMNEKQLKTFV